MNTFAINDRVEVTCIPDQVTRDRDKFPDTYNLLNSAIGRIYSIRSFNKYFMAEVWLQDDASEDHDGIHHSIWIEPQCLRKILP